EALNTDSGKFDRLYWIGNKNYPIARNKMFNRFLKENNLIGMSEDDVVRVLGKAGGVEPLGYKGEIASMQYLYQFSDSCGNDGMYIKMNLSDGVVRSWCFARGKRESEPISTNVIVDELWPKDFRQMLQLFPSTQPK